MTTTNKTLPVHMAMTALILGLFTITGTALVALTYDNTRDKILDAERKALLRNLNAVVRPDDYNNVLTADVTLVTSKDLLGSEQPVSAFRARKDGQPVAVILVPSAPKGYGGPIKLLVGIYYDGRIAGVRVLSHRETPGLGDAIEARRGDWIYGFNDRSLGDPDDKGWRVKRDGGQFDQFTGATITPRAIVTAVKNALEYFKDNREKLFAPQAPEPKSEQAVSSQSDN